MRRRTTTARRRTAWSGRGPPPPCPTTAPRKPLPSPCRRQRNLLPTKKPSDGGNKSGRKSCKKPTKLSKKMASRQEAPQEGPRFLHSGDKTARATHGATSMTAIQSEYKGMRRHVRSEEDESAAAALYRAAGLVR